MGKYKAGDRVRVADHPYYLDDGEDTGTVVGPAERGDRGTVKVALDGYMSLTFRKRELTPLPDNDNAVAPATAEAWVPKVGDRVRLRGAEVGRGEGSIIRTTEAGAHVRYDSWFDGHDGRTGDGTKNCWWDSFDNLEPVVAPATTPLTIKAGKFYRTRDGRKVGPLTKDTWDNTYPFNCSVGFTEPDFVSVAAWKTDGTNYEYRWLDLVAKWVEPIVGYDTKFFIGDEVAVAPATATKWEPKIGEKVRVVRAGANFKEGQIGVEFVITSEDSIWDGERSWYSRGRGEDAGGWRYKTSELAPVVPEPAAPPAKFKVGDRVVIARNSRGLDWLNKHIGTELTINAADGTTSNPGWSFDGHGYWWPSADLDLAPTIRTGATVTFTATGRVSAINENGHVQVTFPDLLPGQNSFALPAKYVSLAN